MDSTIVVVLVVLVIAAGMLIAFRSSLRISLKAFGMSFAASGRNDEAGRSRRRGGKPSPEQTGPRVEASAERSVAVGGNVEGSINTGDSTGARPRRGD